MKFGKTPARKGAMKFALTDYVNKAKLPPVPSEFGHDDLVKNYGMLGNDRYGNCVWAGAAHESMLWNAMAGRSASFTTDNTLEGYTAVTGFNRADPNTDQGTDMVKAAEYRRTIGLPDSRGVRHKVQTYLSLNPGDISDLWAAVYLFGAVGIGLQMPDNAEDQFTSGQPWHLTPGQKIEGGHYVPFAGRRAGVNRVITWGKVQLMTEKFLESFCDEAIAYVSTESLKNNKSPEGFDVAALTADMNALHRAK